MRAGFRMRVRSKIAAKATSRRKVGSRSWAMSGSEGGAFTS